MARHASAPAGPPPAPPRPGPPPAEAPRHARTRRARDTLRRAGTAALALVLFVGSGAAFAYSEIQGNVKRHDISGLLGEDRPGGDATPEPVDARAGQPINILVLGSDVREGESDVDGAGAAGAVTGMRSDTTMIAHVAADRSRVELVSIPRDTLVDIPSCTLADGQQTEPQQDEMFNSAFQIGGQDGDVGAAAACTIRTVEQLTGVGIDDFVVVDFAGFINVVDALGGVPMYIEEDIDDPATGLVLSQGCNVLGGEAALGYARARKAAAFDGSDISRIGRQQELVAAIAREALSKNLLTDLPSLYRFLDAATSTLTTGPYVGGLPTMAGLANAMRGLDAEDIRFTTMPFEWAGPRVRPTAQAAELWAALEADQPIDATLTGTGEAPAEETSPADPATPEDPSAAPTTSPAPAPAAPEPTPTTPICTK